LATILLAELHACDTHVTISKRDIRQYIMNTLARLSITSKKTAS
jgi:hypothetical protein